MFTDWASLPSLDSKELALPDDSRFIRKALAYYFPSRDVTDLSASELSYLLRQSQRLKAATSVGGELDKGFKAQP